MVADEFVRTLMAKAVSNVATQVKRQKRGDIMTRSTLVTPPVTSLCRLEIDERGTQIRRRRHLSFAVVNDIHLNIQCV